MAPTLRRSTRVKAEAQQTETAKNPSKKRQRKDKVEDVVGASDTTASEKVTETGQRRTRIKGRLAGITSMPTDVFMEIASYLAPLDILHLSRSSRRIRSIFMSKKSAFVWRAARKNLHEPLPDVPERLLNEPQYAALMFDSYCQHCGTHSTSTANFTLRLRICEKCYGKNVKQGRSILASISPSFPAKYRAIFMLLPLANPSGWALLRRQSDPNDPMTHFQRDFELGGESRSRFLFYKPAVVKVMRQYDKYMQGSDEQLAFMRKCLEEVNVVYEHAHKLNDLSRIQSRWILFATEITKDKWEKVVLTKLREVGYTSNDFSISGKLDEGLAREWKKLTRQNREFTDRIWSNLFPKLESIILENRENVTQDNLRKRRAHLQMLLKRKYSKYYYDLSAKECAFIPGCIERVHSPLEGEFVEQNLENEELAAVHSLDDQHWEDIMNRGLRAELDEARTALRDRFLALFRARVFEHYTSDAGRRRKIPTKETWDTNAFTIPNCTVPPSSFTLDHAAALFSDADGSFSYTVSAYEASSRGFYSRKVRGEDNNDIVADDWDEPASKVAANWTCRPPVFRVAMALLQSIGCEQASLEEMGSKRVVFVCMSCKEEDRKRKLSWQSLVEHCSPKLVREGGEMIMRDEPGHDIVEGKILVIEGLAKK